MTMPAGAPALEGEAVDDWYTHLAEEPGTANLNLASIASEVYVDACDLRRSTKPLEGGATGLADYLESLPEVTVSDRHQVTLDGRPAIRLRVAVDRTIATAC